MIVACIVNVETGEIIETAETPKEKLPLRLKCRDHYNKQQTNDRLFLTVEFSTAHSYAYAIDMLKARGGKTVNLQPLIKLYRLWRIDQLQTVQIPAAQAALEHVRKLDPGDYQWAKDEELSQAADNIRDLQSDLRELQNKLSKM